MTASRRTVGSRVLDLCSPDSGTFGQGVRYAAAGSVVALVGITATIVLADVLAIPFQLALIAGSIVTVCVHFTLQRLFVWVDHAKFALGFGKQVGRYLLVVGIQYAVIATSTSLLPGIVGIPVTFVYLATVLALTGINFLVFRNGVFHPVERSPAVLARSASSAADVVDAGECATSMDTPAGATTATSAYQMRV